jgi:hypothetical protein
MAQNAVPPICWFVGYKAYCRMKYKTMLPLMPAHLPRHACALTLPCTCLVVMALLCVQPDTAIPLGDPITGGPWRHERKDPGSYEGGTVF